MIAFAFAFALAVGLTFDDYLRPCGRCWADAYGDDSWEDQADGSR